MKEERKEKKFSELEENEIQIDQEEKVELGVVNVFGMKIARALVSIDWKHKEHAMKVVHKQVEKYMDMANKEVEKEKVVNLTKAAALAVSYTCKEKVIKVLMSSLTLLNLLIGS